MTLLDKYMFRKPAFLFLKIKDGMFEAELDKFNIVTYSHIVDLIKIYEEAGLITTKVEGRKRIITLTEKGIKLKKHLKEIKKELVPFNT